MNYEIARACAEDFDLGIWQIFKSVIKSGDTYIYAPETTKEQAKKIWFLEHCYVVRETQNNKIVGTYVIRPNKEGLGSHVANAGFMVHPDYQNQKIGSLMCRHALNEAAKIGYKAMQFNVVVSTNKRAISLWTKMGFKIIGTVPKAFNHLEKGLVDVHIMHRFL